MIPVFQPLLDEKEIKASQKVIEVDGLVWEKMLVNLKKNINIFGVGR